ncbi:MAG: VWA domain-containing protein [Planctomycetes bacterium]|nr:VWA domain-containing protein [Planctomycetota bacterium]MBI3844121.1 VWA domain-containing protein [Planctomycetota bacterium]
MLSNFINPGILWWAIPLGLVPIIIHLLNRRRYRRVPWAAMEFLVQAYKRTHRRVRMENLILLLVRVLLLLLATLAISRPFLSKASFLPIAQKKTNLVLVVDNSYSMGYRYRYSTAFERAKAAGAQILDALATERGDTVSLVAMGSQPHVIIQQSLMLKQAHEEFDKLALGFEGTDPARSIDEARRIAKELRTNQEVYVITDLQRRAWCPEVPADSGATGGTRAADTSGRLREALAGLTADGIRTYVVDVGADEHSNVAVTEVSTDERLVATGRPTVIRARVTNFASDEANFRTALFVGGEVKENRPLESLGGGESKTVEFTYTFLTAGPADVAVETDADPLPTDNRRHLALEVRDRIRVLVVDGDPEPKSNIIEKESGYLVYALDPEFNPDDSGSTGLYQIDSAYPYNVSLRTFADYDLVVLCNVSALPRDKSEDLVRYVNGGGGVLAFLGNRVDSKTWNEQFYKSDGSGLLPGPLGEPVSWPGEEGSYHFTVRSYDHPVLKPFEPRDLRKVLELSPVRRFLSCAVPTDSSGAAMGARVLIYVSDDKKSPALVTKTLGAGKVALMTIPATTTASPNDPQNWTELPRYPAFLPLVRELTDWLSARSLSLRNLSLGEPIRKTVNRFVQEAWVTAPSGAREKAENHAVNGATTTYEISFTSTQTPGFYRLAIAGAAIDADASPQSDVFAVNLDANEGDVQKATEDEFRKRYPEFRFDYLTQAPHMTEGDAKPQQGEIWKFLLFTVLALLFLESFLAQRFGDYAKR